jgi:hypothetical protein
MKPPKKPPTELMQLKAVCQSAGRIASPFSTYLEVVSGGQKGGRMTGVPKVASEGGDGDHGTVDLSIEAPITE